MEQTTPQPGQPGTSIRRTPTTAPPVIRTRQEAPPPPRIRQPSVVTRALESAMNYVISEETLTLVQFLVVVAIGIFVFVAVLHPMENLVSSINHAISGLGLGKLFK